MGTQISKNQNHGIGILISAILIILCSAFYSDAGLSVENYIKAKNTSGFDLYIGGIGQGIHIANTELKVNHRPTLYCLPENKKLHADDYIALIDGYLIKNRANLKLETSISAVLLLALEKEYTCSKKRSRQFPSTEKKIYPKEEPRASFLPLKGSARPMTLKKHEKT